MLFLQTVMTYNETLTYLYNTLPMFSRIGKAAYKTDLTNTLALVKAIGNPEQRFKTIHVAGTNGKGSTSHMLAAILQAAGYKTGLYTSPHIKDFGERIKINGEQIDQQFIIDFVERTKELVNDVAPSFFELTVAMAFEYFANEKVDIAIIECGLGGRLDSTNIINPLLSVITNIGYDHMDILGNTLGEIAAEKAGIIKPKIPVVIGEYNSETLPVFIETAQKHDAELILASDVYNVTDTTILPHGLQFTITKSATTTLQKVITDLNGLYQAKNICAVLAAVDALKKQGFKITNAAVQQGLGAVKQTTGLTGRWQVLQQKPLVVCDVAHNSEGVAQILIQLNISYPNKPWHFIMGFVKDKELDKVLKLLPTNATYYFTNAQIPRALPKELLQEEAAKYFLKGHCFTDVQAALTQAKNNAGKEDVIVIFGSFFVVAEVQGI